MKSVAPSICLISFQRRYVMAWPKDCKQGNISNCWGYICQENCFIETNGLAKHFTTAPEMRTEFKKVTVMTVNCFSNESGLYRWVARLMSLYSAGHQQEHCDFSKRMEVGPQKSSIRANCHDKWRIEPIYCIFRTHARWIKQEEYPLDCTVSAFKRSSGSDYYAIKNHQVE